MVIRGILVQRFSFMKVWPIDLLASRSLRPAVFFACSRSVMGLELEDLVEYHTEYL